MKTMNEHQQQNHAPTPHHTTFTFMTVRTVIVEGKPWFVARDVAECLGYPYPKDAIRDNCKYAKILKGELCSPLTSSPRGINIIPESDVYRLIMRSQLPDAEAFQDWVVEKVLPALRQHGGYMTTRPEESPEDTMARALLIAQQIIDRQQ